MNSNAVGFFAGFAIVCILAFAMELANATTFILDISAMCPNPNAGGTVGTTNEVYVTDADGLNGVAQCTMFGANQVAFATSGDAFKAPPEPPFNVATLNTTRLRDAFAAGFIVVATGLLIVFGVRIIIRAVRTA